MFNHDIEQSPSRLALAYTCKNSNHSFKNKLSIWNLLPTMKDSITSLTILCSYWVHCVFHLWGQPWVYLERGWDSLKRVALGPDEIPQKKQYQWLDFYPFLIFTVPCANVKWWATSLAHLVYSNLSHFMQYIFIWFLEFNSANIWCC